MDTILVSIIVPIYNMGNSIESCIQSITDQDYKNLEILLIDDGSTDNSLDVCKHLKEKDNRIQVFHTENRGSGPARNYGIEKAKGDYAYFPDADDYLEPNAISCLVKATQFGIYDLVVFGFKIMTRSGHLIKCKDYKDSIYTGKELRESYAECLHYVAPLAIQGAPWNKFFSLKVIKENKIEYPPLRRHQDEGFISRYMCYTQNVHFIENVLYTYFENEVSDQWRKFPVDYIDAVVGLYQIRKETIVAWNKDDKETHLMVYCEYLIKIVKALELSFSPKLHSNKIKRINYLETIYNKTNISELSIPPSLPIYQRSVCKLFGKKYYTLTMAVVWIKITLEKLGFSKLKQKIYS